VTATNCTWPVDYAACSGCEVLEGLPPEQQDVIEKIASDLLWNWTNQVFGVCPVELRPCAAGCYGSGSSTFWGRGPYPWHGSGVGSSPWYPVLIGGQWYNLSCGCVSSCDCAVNGPTALQLPGPVADIIEVKVDGLVIPPTSYRVAYGRTLIRTDGEVWPACQDLLAEDTELNTFVVSYNRGLAVPVGGQVAAGILACEIAKMLCGAKDCQLPQRLQTITRQGVTMGFVDTFEGLDQGKTGIWGIDAWISSVTRHKSYANVRSVDVPNPLSPAGRPWPTG
jgi:hypothetical protein